MIHFEEEKLEELPKMNKSLWRKIPDFHTPGISQSVADCALGCKSVGHSSFPASPLLLTAEQHCSVIKREVRHEADKSC